MLSHFSHKIDTRLRLPFHAITQREFDDIAHTRRQTNNGASTYASYIACIQTKFSESGFHCITV